MIYVMSGGGGKAVGAISVTYPVGSTCTCTNGSKTLKAKDTSGKALFLVPTTGTWTASYTLNGVTKSKSVTITANDVARLNVISLVLDVINSMEKVANTAYGNGSNRVMTAFTPTKVSDGVFIIVDDGNCSTLYLTKQRYDLTQYTKLVCSYHGAEHGNGSYDRKYGIGDKCFVGVFASNATTGQNAVASKNIVSTTVTTPTSGTITLDISSVNSGYLGFNFATDAWEQLDITITDFHLE